MPCSLHRVEMCIVNQVPPLFLVHPSAKLVAGQGPYQLEPQGSSSPAPLSPIDRMNPSLAEFRGWCAGCLPLCEHHAGPRMLGDIREEGDELPGAADCHFKIFVQGCGELLKRLGLPGECRPAVVFDPGWFCLWSTSGTVFPRISSRFDPVSRSTRG